MTIVVGAAGLLSAAFLWLLHVVLTKEYPDWGRRLARGLIAVAAMGVPKDEREDLREEWEAELAAIPEETDGQATGLTFALWLVARYGAVGVGRSLWVWLRRRPTRSRLPRVEISRGYYLPLQRAPVAGSPIYVTESGRLVVPLDELPDWMHPQYKDRRMATGISSRRWVFLHVDELPEGYMQRAVCRGVVDIGGWARSGDDDPGTSNPAPPSG